MTELHFSRYRKRGEPDWYDPMTDIRKMVPQVLSAVLAKLEDQYADRPELQDIQYLHNCIRVFQIKVLEDPAPLTALVKEFFEALNVVPREIRFMWFSQVVSALLCIYALFCRRDSAVDGAALHSMLETTRLALLEDTLSPELWEKVRRQLQTCTSLLVSSRTCDGDMVVCHETGDVIENVRDLVKRYLGKYSGSWSEMATLCEQAFSAPDGKRTDREQIALALAYPTYSQPTLTVIQNNEPQGETEESGN